MALSEGRSIYGVHSLTLYDRTTWEPFGIIKILGSVNFELTGSFNDLYGGSNRYPWDSEAGVVETNITGTIKEVPDFIFDKFTGGSSTANAAEASGNTGTLTNQNGALVDATTGVATATTISGSEADLKDAIYIIKAVTATTVDVYAMSDVDFSKGTDLEYVDDLLKITATPLTIADTSAVVAIPNTGVELTSGSGTVAMTVDDTAYVYTRKVNSGSSIIDVGSALQEFPEFGVVYTTARKSNGDVFEGQFFRCKGIGLPLSHGESAWLETDVTIKALFDSAKQKVGTFRQINAA